MNSCYQSIRIILGSLLIAGAATFTAYGASVYPTPTTNDLNNPHKGFMLWGTDYAAGAPDNYHGSTIYHVYVPWREIETSDQVFDWDSFETNHLIPILNDDSNATVVLRPVADYPDGAGSGLTGFYTGGETQRDYPKFLEQAPLNIAFNDYASCDGDGPGRTPDWDDPAMITQMTQFISAIQARYDGDLRITCIQVGLLGLWGEWHQSGCDAWEASSATKALVRDHYNNSFTNTPLQTRYPRNPDAVGVEFGFHEDYFPSFTAPCVYGFPLCDDSGNWNMDYGYSNETPSSLDNWMSNPISGESPLTSQKNSWINNTTNILTVLQDYHFSFLGPAGKHEDAGNTSVLQEIKRTLGYNYHIVRFDWPDQIQTGTVFNAALVMTNSGSAPTYRDFPIELSLCDETDTPVWTAQWNADLRSLKPNMVWSNAESFTASGVATGVYAIRVAVLNPRFNSQPGVLLQNHGRDAGGRYHMGNITVMPSSPPDSDGDGIPDAWELAHGLNPSISNAPTDDLDGDSVPDWWEYIADTDANDSNSLLLATATSSNGGPIKVSFDSSTGRMYTLEYADALASNTWNIIPGQSHMLGTSTNLTLIDSNAPLQRNYRIGVHLP